MISSPRLSAVGGREHLRQLCRPPGRFDMNGRLGDADSAACHRSKADPEQGFCRWFPWGPSCTPGWLLHSPAGSGCRMRLPCEPRVNAPTSAQVLKCLNKTYQSLKRKPVAVDLDPKAVTCDELFGIINPATREWKDGNRSGGPGRGCAGGMGPPADMPGPSASTPRVHTGPTFFWSFRCAVR